MDQNYWWGHGFGFIRRWDTIMDKGSIIANIHTRHMHGLLIFSVAQPPPALYPACQAHYTKRPVMPLQSPDDKMAF